MRNGPPSPWPFAGSGGTDPLALTGDEVPFPWFTGEEVPFPWFTGEEVPFPWLVAYLVRNGVIEGEGGVSIVPQHSTVQNVETAQLVKAGAGYPDLYLVATGTTETLGWRDAVLIPRVHITPPADGIFEFDLIARGASCLTAIGSVIASSALVDRPEGFKGARVFPGGVEAKL